MRKLFIRLLPVIVLVTIMVAIGIFLFSRGNADGEIGKYSAAGVSEVTLGGDTYVLVNDVLTERYVGSQIRSFVRGVRGEQIGTIKSFVVFTVARLFRVRGDESGRYIVDSSDRIYVKKEFSDGVAERIADKTYFPRCRILDGAQKDTDKDIEKSTELPADAAAMLRSLTGEEVEIDDKLVVMDYTNRREILSFTEDGLFFQVEMELFLYKGSVYLTTGFEGNQSARADQKLRGIRLPDDRQEQFLVFWK